MTRRLMQRTSESGHWRRGEPGRNEGVAGGLLMALVALGVFSLALVVLTAGAGAALLVQAIAAPDPWGVVLLVALWIAGVVVQRRTQS